MLLTILSREENEDNLHKIFYEACGAVWDHQPWLRATLQYERQKRKGWHFCQIQVTETCRKNCRLKWKFFTSGGLKNHKIFHNFGPKLFENSSFKEIEVGHVCLELMVSQHGH